MMFCDFYFYGVLFMLFSCGFTMKTSFLLPPASVKGIQVLNRDLFKRDITVPVLQIVNEALKSTINCIKSYMLKLENFKAVQCDGENENIKLVYLNPERISSFESFPSSIKDALSKLGIVEKNILFLPFTLTYDHWKADEIIRSVLPGPDLFSSYSVIGHIIHLNLKETLFPYKQLIGQVLLDKIKSCRTVVNKVEMIDNRFRNFNMELLAGDSDFKTTVKESNCTFEFDFSEVYWNPRLSTEHARLISLFNSNDLIFDVFAGVGPFSVPAAKKGCFVLANDLNPACYKWLENNKRINSIKRGVLISSNKDGFDFIKEDVKSTLLSYSENERYNAELKAHVIMNLPSLSHTFLPAFNGLLSHKEINSIPNNLFPIIHVYCFVKNQTPEYAVKLIQNSFNVDISDSIVEVFNVRNVAPNKEMIRVSFTLSPSLWNKINLSTSEQDINLSKRSLNVRDNEESCTKIKKNC